jgi:hypothetical protein
VGAGPRLLPVPPRVGSHLWVDVPDRVSPQG